MLILAVLIHMRGEFMDSQMKQKIDLEFFLTLVLFVLLISISFISWQTFMLNRRIYEKITGNFAKSFEIDPSKIDLQYESCTSFNITLGDKTYDIISTKCVINYFQSLDQQINQSIAIAAAQGYAVAVDQLIRQAKSSCDPFDVFLENNTVTLINVECLLNNRSS